jgi:Domain of unknown function (DUF4105)
MKKNLRLVYFVSLLLVSRLCIAQDSSHIRISLLTCTPGEELYSTFGHSGIRLYDSSRAINDHPDIVFNYGTFNFDDPNFYMKFIRGKLLYFVSAADFQEFKEEYQYSNRGITEQVLNLTAAEKISLEHFLFENIKEENKYYKYDFFFDNCTTRLRDIIFQHKKNHPALKAVMPEGTRFREAIHQYLDKNNKQWSKLGIDILLGVPTDAVMTTAQSQFLPEILMKAFDSTNTNHELVLSTTNLYPLQDINGKPSFFTPVVVFGMLLLLIILLDLSKQKWALAFLSGFDGLLFFLTGAIGILLIFMWTGTDHTMTKGNYNLLWAWPTHAVAAFFINSKKHWIKKYLMLTSIGLVIVLLSWFFLPQQLNNSLILICVLLLFRSVKKYMAF